MTWTILALLFQRFLGTSLFSEDRNFIQIDRNRRSLLPVVKKVVCYPEVGCFDLGPPFFHPVTRPLLLPPQPPEVIGTVFQLYTRRNKNHPIYITARQHMMAVKAVYNPSAYTRIIIGGFIDNMMLTTWMERLKNQLLALNDDNVFLVNWSNANRPPYSQAVANTRVVGVQIANLIDFLWKIQGTPPERIHIIGHSLGAQIAGYAAERIRTIGRITGLDPAGPLFRNVPNEVRLDPSDATFVDVIHSDPAKTLITGLGTTDDNGHLDFYPGGGDPPGCVQTVVRSAREDIPTETYANVVACQHLRAIEFFGYSFNQGGCVFIGVRCTSYKDFIDGLCDCGTTGEKCAIMGFYSPLTYPAYAVASHHPSDRRLYLKVGKERPYCLHQYQVIVYLHPGFMSFGMKSFNVDFFIVGSHEELYGRLPIEITPEKQRQGHRFLLTTKRRIGSVVSAKARLVTDEHFQHSPKIFSNVLHKIRVTYLYPSFYCCLRCSILMQLALVGSTRDN